MIFTAATNCISSNLALVYGKFDNNKVSKKD